MACKGGRRAGSGRPKGVPNKITTEVKAAIVAAFEKVGGSDYLVKIAGIEPRAFCALLGRVVPTEIKADVAVSEGLAERVKRAKARAGMP